MPVECQVELAPVGQERFHAVDKVVMRHAFDIHNTMGRFCDERIYQEELARRCRSSGLEVHQEVTLRAMHGNFAKAYYLDLLIERGIIYELKAAEMLDSSHQTQLINYLLLADLCHGKLVNFRPSSVDSRFVSTRLRRQDRLMFQLDASAWLDNDVSRRLRDALCALLADWGTFLDVALYREALLHLLSGAGVGIQPVEIVVDGSKVGSQKMCILDNDTAWHLSTVRQQLASYETHLVRLLSHTRLAGIHWINLNQRVITLKTLTK